MNRRALSPVSALLGTVTLERARELAQLALDAPSAAEARERVRAELPDLERFGL